jgi:hypothetical protein
MDYAVRVNGDSVKEAQAEVGTLKKEGFQEGVEERLSTSQDEALSDALVFSRAKGAQRELNANASEDIGRHHAGLKQFTVAAIPGSVGFGQQRNHIRGATADVLFTTGRCFFLVGVAMNDGATQKQANNAVVSGAIALYRRLKRLCA